MKAIVYREYGSPEVLRVEEVERPSPDEDEVLVRVRAVALNASDWELLTGAPLYARIWGLLKPKNRILGSDIAGRVEAVGRDVKRLAPGDEVFGDIFGRWGGFAEYVCAPEEALVRKPPGMRFEEAAALPQAGVIALQGLRDKGKVRPGQHVLINGAGGGAGTFAIQIARSFGAAVTGVDSARKLDTMRELGAENVVDYAREDFTRNGRRYDLILDLVGHHSIFGFRRSLAPGGRYVMVGGSVGLLLQTLLVGSAISLCGSRKMRLLAAKPNRADLGTILELIEAGAIRPVIDRLSPLDEVPAALRYLGAGKARGKLVVTVPPG